MDGNQYYCIFEPHVNASDHIIRIIRITVIRFSRKQAHG